jgi:basic membrane protein A
MKRKDHSSLRLLMALLAVIGVLVAVAGCGSDDKASSDSAKSDTPASDAPAEGGEAKKIRVGLVLNGPRNDKSFAQSHYDGLLLAEKEVPGVELVSTIENADTPQKRIDAYKNLAPKVDVVYGAGAYFTETVPAIAPLFPKVKFLVSTGVTAKEFENAHSFVPEEGLTAIAAGAVSAKLSKSKKIGFIGGAEIPPTLHNLEGVKLGAKEIDPSVTVASTIVGDFNDVAKAKAAAEAQIADGVDQIFAFLDAGIQGVYQAAGPKKIPVHQIIAIRCDEYEHVFGSAKQNNLAMVVDGLKQVADGTLKPGATFYTLKTPEILSYELCPPYKDDPELQGIVDDITARVNSGELKVPAPVLNARPEYEVIER